VLVLLVCVVVVVGIVAAVGLTVWAVRRRR